VFIFEDMTLKLGEFHHSLYIGSNKYLKGNNEGDSFRGQPGYIAPELIDNQKPKYDCSSDIWSAGVLIYEMLTAQKPSEFGPKISVAMPSFELK
jgi:serine/threonine protein kinase